MKLWQKDYTFDARAADFEARANAALDQRLARHDIWGSLAHAAMLTRIGVLSAGDLHAIRRGLLTLLDQVEAGRFAVTTADEDVHTKVENELTALIGEPGKRIHTARSRNDQVLVDLRLYGKEQLHQVAAQLCALVDALATFAAAHAATPMPGYTHMQRAMVATVGLWAGAFAESLLDDEGLLAAAYALNDQCPLGSAAGYGVPLPLDRAYTAALLGFAGVQANVLAVQNGRGKIEGAIVQALAQIMLDLSRLAQDILLFTTAEYGFLRVPPELCSGSSIMPQKRNLGIMELVRARAQTVLALQQQILGIVAGLPSGYNMDAQETKGPFMQALDLTGASLAVTRQVVAGLAVDEPRLIAACSPDLFATDRAYALVRDGVPFRDAYRRVAAELASSAPHDAGRTEQDEREGESHPLPRPFTAGIMGQGPDGAAHIPATQAEARAAILAHLRARQHFGSPIDLGLPALRVRLEAVAARWQAREDRFTAAIAALIEGMLGTM
jgi:argininosuccinate lyase